MAKFLQSGPESGFAIQAGVDDFGHFRRQVGPQVGQQWQVPFDRPQGEGRGRPAPGVLPGPGFKEGQGERVDVPGRGHRVAFRRFRGHVGERPEDVTGIGQVIAVGQPGDPEIHQFGAAPSVRDDQVGRLDVPVDHLAGMRVIKRFADVDPDLPDFPVADQVPVHQLPHRVPVDQFRNEIGPAAFPAVLVVGEFVEGDDAGVVEPGRRLRLPLDPGTGLGSGLDHLDRDLALQPAVPGAVDRAESSGAKPVSDLESVEHDRSVHHSALFGVKAPDPPLSGTIVRFRSVLAGISVNSLQIGVRGSIFR